MDVAGLRANLQRARDILEREDRLAELEAETRDDAGRTADVMRAWNESAARAEEMLSVDEDDAEETETGREISRAAPSKSSTESISSSTEGISSNASPAGSALASMEDIDRFDTEGASAASGVVGAGGLASSSPPSRRRSPRSRLSSSSPIFARRSRMNLP